MKSLPPQEYLRSRIEYDPETGEARWKEVDESFGSKWRWFNSRYSGKPLNSRITIHKQSFSLARVLYKLHNGEDVVKVKFLDGDANNLCAYNLLGMYELGKKIERLKDLTKPSKVYKPIPAEISNLLRYDHRTGELIWKERDSPSFNTRYAGRPAGYISDGYIKVRSSSFGVYFAHRIAWYLYYGEDPGEYQIDHKDGVRNNNSILNLRLATNSLNSQERSLERRFTQRESTGRWSSVMYIKNNPIRLGDFDTPQEAQQAYDEAIKRYKPTYEFTAEEQAVLDELYRTYPRCETQSQRRAHCLQVKAVQWYETAFQRATNEV